MYLGKLLFAVRFDVLISLLWFLFIVYYHLLVMQYIANTVSLLKLQWNVQFSSLVNDERQVTRVELKIFTRFALS